MEDLDVLPIVVLGIGLLLIWGGLTGQSPVGRVKQVLTKGGVQTYTAAENSVLPTAAPVTYTVRRDYLA